MDFVLESVRQGVRLKWGSRLEREREIEVDGVFGNDFLGRGDGFPSMPR